MTASAFKIPAEDPAAEDSWSKQSSRQAFTFIPLRYRVESNSLLSNKLGLRCRPRIAMEAQ